MTQAKNPTMTDSAKRLGDEVYQAGRKLYLFGIGSAVAAGDGLKDLFGRMVARGEEAERKVREDPESFVNRAGGSAREVGRFVEEKVQGTVSGTLARAGVPSRTEISELIARVEELTKKVEALSEGRGAETPRPTDQ